MADELIGKVIGGYDVLRRIGDGGMATVYLARQQSMDREVALKVLPRHHLKEDMYLQRFEREVHIVSKLEHRNIIPVYDYGEHAGQPYIVMRYMPAGSIDDLLQKGPLTPDKILDILKQVAPALDYAHSKDILHRDLKPSNVLMDDGGGAFITDFGIARLLGEPGAGITTQGVVGTPSYMSPEQAQGKDLDGRSDVYALGVMLFEMATGRRPFESDTAYSIAVMQVTTAPPSPCTLNPALSNAIERVLLKALQKPRDHRYQTAQALLDDFQKAVHNPQSLHDTDPHMKPLPDAAVDAVKANVASSSVSPAIAPLQQRPAYRTPPPSSVSSLNLPNGNSSPSLRSQIRRKRKENPWLSALIGGAIGCGLLSVLVALGFFSLSVFLPLDDTNSRQNERPLTAVTDEVVAAESSPRSDSTPTVTLDAISSTARALLLERQENNDATAAASDATTDAAPTRTPGIDPVGIRSTPELLVPLRESTGELIFADTRGDDDGERTLEIVKLDVDTWTETQLTQDSASDSSYPVASPDGRWIVFQSDRDGDFEIYIMNPGGGQVQQMTFNRTTDRLASWSPDGEWIIYSADDNDDGRYDIRRVRLDGSADELVYSDGNRNSHARYSPDGRYITFTAGSDPLDARTWEIARLDTDTDEVIRLTNNDTRDASAVWSPEGDTLLYSSSDDDGNQALSTMAANGDNQRVLYDTSGLDWAAAYSPDGEYIVFTSNVNGSDQLYLMTANGESVQQITSGGGLYASWIPERE